MDKKISLETLEKISMKMTNMTFSEANDYLDSLPRKVFKTYQSYDRGDFVRSVDLEKLDYGLEHN